MRNALVFGWLSLAVLTATAGAQQTTIVPQVRTKPTADNKNHCDRTCGTFRDRDPGAGACEFSRSGRPGAVPGGAFRT